VKFCVTVDEEAGVGLRTADRNCPQTILKELSAAPSVLPGLRPSLHPRPPAAPLIRPGPHDGHTPASNREDLVTPREVLALGLLLLLSPLAVAYADGPPGASRSAALKWTGA